MKFLPQAPKTTTDARKVYTGGEAPSFDAPK